MTKLCLLMGNQLTLDTPALRAINRAQDLVLLCEIKEEASYVPHHPKKIAFIFSAMRHFATQLKTLGYRVRYVDYESIDNTGCFESELMRAIDKEHIAEVHVTHPGEWRVLQKLHDLQKILSIPLKIHEDTSFLCAMEEFKQWAKGKKQLRMAYFYQNMRRKHQILMDSQGKPFGGQWSYDSQNRRNANHIQAFPQRITHTNDQITVDVLRLVNKHFSHHFGELHPFDFAVTREAAIQESQDFIKYRLKYFGDYQDAMRQHEAYLYHSRLSFYLNIGLLMPLELCQMAETAFHEQLAPLNCVEGFIRQILGWREYVRGLYWLMMPNYQHLNFFNAFRPLPALFWGGDTRMFCIQEVVRQTRVEAYSHHIQRLMITGNFALLTGLNPKAVCEWYLAVYADAFEWVELPNTLGMALYADGGFMASKPYAASGNYINKMSDFCRTCHYRPTDTLGEKACPFNALYWRFISENKPLLKHNNRLHYAYLNWDKKSKEMQTSILAKAEQLLNNLEKNLL